MVSSSQNNNSENHTAAETSSIQEQEKESRGVGRSLSDRQILHAGQAIRLEELSCPLKLISGRVDVFAVQIDSHDQWIYREFLFSLKSGSLIWPQPNEFVSANEATKIGFIAVCSAETETLSISEDAAETSSSDYLSEISRGLDAWVTELSRTVGQYASPSNYDVKRITPAQKLDCKGNNRLAPSKGVAWVHLVSGSASFLGVCKVSDQGTSAPVPITPNTWISTTEDVRADVLHTKDVIKNLGVEVTLNIFHKNVFQIISERIKDKTDSESARLKKKADETEEQKHRTLSKFAAVMGDAQVNSDRISAERVLLVAVKLITDELHMELDVKRYEMSKSSGSRPLKLDDIAKSSHFRVRRLALRGEWWKTDSGPLLIYSEDDGRPIALLRKGLKHYIAHDVANGTTTIVDRDYVSDRSFFAYSFYPPLPSKKISPLDLLRFGLDRSVRDIITVLATGAAGGIIGTLIPIMTLVIFDSVVPSHEKGQLFQIGLGLVIAAIATMTFKVVGDIAFLRIEGRIAGTLQGAVLDRLLRLPNSFLNAYSAGDLTMRTMMIENVRRSVSSIVISSLLAVGFSVFSYGLLFYYAPSAAWVATALFIILTAFAFSVGFRQLKAIMEGEELSGNIYGLVPQIINGISKLRLAGAEDRAFSLWGNTFGELRRRMVQARRIRNQFAVFDSGYQVITMAAIFASIALISGDELTTGAYLAFIAAFTTFLNSSKQMAQSVISIFSVVPLYKRGKPILEAAPETDPSKQDPGELSGKVEVNQVTFRYQPDGPRILNGVTLRVGAGEYVAVVGASGSGKSTLVRMLLGFEAPEFGGVYYDGQDLRGIDLLGVRRQIGVVLQNGKLMPGSIFENIQGATDCTLDEIWNAARLSGIEQDIREMPMGMHTMLTEGTSALSGGQVQRLLIARALVTKPRLLLFDEATSALDNKTQKTVSESLEKLSVTRIAIAHRLSTVKNADLICVMKKGRIVESGTYDHLMQLNGEFTELARRQLL
ncbi:MAG: NHLP bacteriocin export ABC transporter permease/ATPase subunit [Rhodospirillaceae bacterium]